MIVSCPSCETRFNLDAAAFKNGRRRVRCGRCGHKWTATDPRHEALYVGEEEDDPFAAAAPAPSLDALPDLDMEAVEARRAAATMRGLPDDEETDEDAGPAPRGSMKRAMAVVIGLMAIGAVAGGLYYADTQGVLDDLIAAGEDAVSGSAGDSFGGGLPVIDESETRVRLVGQQRDGRTIQVFEVTGLIRNTEDTPIRVPPMVGRFQSADGDELFYNDDRNRPAIWTFDAPTPALQPGETARFRTIVDVAAAPARAENIEISFAQ